MERRRGNSSTTTGEEKSFGKRNLGALGAERGYQGTFGYDARQEGSQTLKFVPFGREGKTDRTDL